jgi:hypothetical protein
MAHPIQTARLIAPTSRHQAFYTIWIEACEQGFLVVKESGAGDKVWDRRSWVTSSLAEAEKLFSRRVKEKTSPERKSVRKYELP